MSVVFELALKRILKQHLTLALIILFPIILSFLPQPAGMGTPIIGYGIFGLVILFSTFLLTKQIIEDRQYKTIIRIAASPTTHKDYLLGHLGAYMLVMLLQITLFWVISVFRWEAPLSFYLWGYLLLLLFTIMSVSFSLFWHSLFKTYATSIAVYSIVANLMAVIGGMSFPLSLLPDNLRTIAVVLPTYWYAYGLESATDNVSNVVILCLLILMGFAIIFLTIGSKRRLN
ncbi:MAG: ABC transporter permease [Candidatus Izemoplasmataceae bacterium]|jgi:ABC-2 type transport system permease protein|uniref:ABC transporter permease n=1 Tax=Liberiplasma polymorphum TaxID=3374570 RepID=UPI003776A0A6